MSDDREELELQALQRELDDAFETTRPRRGFEDELWSRLQRRRPFWMRLRDAIGAFPGALRGLPAVPTAAIAAVLVVAVGIGVLAIGGGLHPPGSTLSESAAAPRAPAEHTSSGLLPTPVLHPGYVDSGVQAAAPAPNGAVPFGPLSSAASAHLYFGPATMDWTGTFASPTVDAPVLSYTEPGLPLADQFAASLGASSGKQVRQVNGFLGTYMGADFTVSVRGSVSQLPREPFFVLTPSASVSVQGDTPAAIAGAFLAKYSLVPQWPYTVIVQQTDQQNARVVYARESNLPSSGSAYFIDWIGERYGIEVEISQGKPVLAFGELPLSLTSVSYRLISNDAAAQAAVSAQASGPAVITPAPVVHLDEAQLVYALAVGDGQGYFEPAYLFSGTFAYNGETYVKRVLVPLVDPSLRSS
ncbi:MAG TPA: hypothetical protein VKT20_03340 [Candidatus Dormibacteraeota bacterium]|nr:hypothetical protein [Candidatus Dormibacteraeota bacterium]